MENIINSLVKYFKYFVGVTFILIISLLFSCEKDFDINAKWKDITVVYGLLNQNDSLHIIKVNKAFLGDANAFSMAKISDSLNYTNVSVKLEQITNNVTVHTINLRDTIFPKAPGIFATDNNKVFITSEILDPSSTYNLLITIPGKAPITASTNLINGLTVSKPDSYNPNGIGFDTASAYRVEFLSTRGAKLYELTIRFYYYEILNGDTSLHFIDWVQNQILSSNLYGNQGLKLDISGSSFYQFVANRILPIPGVKRIVSQKSLDFIFLAGGDDLNTYIEVSGPSNTIVQEKPFYTNISNGIGIFSCRFDKTIKGKVLSSYSIDLLANGRFTKNLGFQNFYTTHDVYWPNFH